MKKSRQRHEHSDSSNSSSDDEESFSDEHSDSCDKDDDDVDNVDFDKLLLLSAHVNESRKTGIAGNHFTNDIAPLAPSQIHTNQIIINANKSFENYFDVTQFSRSCIGSSKYLVNAHFNIVSDDDLVFESRFESGNLAKAIKITSVYYELYLRPDLYTNKHTQWFYFRVKNVKKGITYRYLMA